MVRRRRVVAAWASIVLVAVTLAACSGDDESTSRSPSTTSKVYTEQDSDITVTRGATFVIELPATPSTGYSWSAQDDELVSLENSEPVRGGSAPGAAGMQRLTFRAQATGSTTLELDYARPFEPGEPPAQTASFDVTVTA
jgi:inhibitor of cysteine peptidase